MANLQHYIDMLRAPTSQHPYLSRAQRDDIVHHLRRLQQLLPAAAPQVGGAAAMVEPATAVQVERMGAEIEARDAEVARVLAKIDEGVDSLLKSAIDRARSERAAEPAAAPVIPRPTGWCCFPF